MTPEKFSKTVKKHVGQSWPLYIGATITLAALRVYAVRGWQKDQADLIAEALEPHLDELAHIRLELRTNRRINVMAQAGDTK